LVLGSAGIDGLSNDEVNQQLNFYQEEEKKHPSTQDPEKMPLKSHMSIK